MLPSPAELRELSERIREAAPRAHTEEMKVMLGGHASLLAEVAERLERDTASVDPLLRRANIERYERLLAGALDERTRSTVEALLAQDNAAAAQQRRQVEAWRRRAEELRTTADQFTVPSVQGSLRRAAHNLDVMADHAEGLLTARRSAPGEKAR